MSASDTLKRADEHPFVDSIDLSNPNIRAANAVLAELSDRGGIGNMLDELDYDIREEILMELAELIALAKP